MIKAVIFDCFGVLYNNPKSHLFNLVPEDAYDTLNDLCKQADYGYISGRDFTQSVARLAGVSPEELDRLMDNLYVRNDPLFEWIQVVKQQFKIGLLSNVGDDLIDKLFTSNEQTSYFDAVVTSSTVGIVKPAQEIYELVANKLGVLVGECLFIDDVQSNVDGAKKAGMRAVLFRTNTQLEQDWSSMIGEDSNA